MNQQINNQSQELAAALNKSRQVAVVIAEADFDAVAAGLALFLSLREAQKEGQVFVGQQAKGDWRQLSGVENLRTNLGQENLTIALHYPLEKIEKVSSDDSRGQLQLVVRLKEGAEPIKKEQVAVETLLEKPDMGFLFGASTAVKMPASWLQGEPCWVWFDRQGRVNQPGVRFNLADSQSGYSEVVARLIQSLGLPFNAKIAANLYRGIWQATRSFANVRDYHTLETAALCFKVFQPRPQSVAQPAPSPQPAISGVEADKQPVENVESKEGGGLFSQTKVTFPTPKIFRGSTTPKGN